MSKKKIELLVRELIMPLPWVKELPKKIKLATIPNAPVVKKQASPANSNNQASPATVSKTPNPALPKKEKKPKPTLKKVSLGKLGKKLNTGGISIKQTLKEKEEEKSDTFINTAADPFTFDHLMRLWNVKVEEAREQNKKSLHASLTKHKPVLNKDYSIDVFVDNKVQEETVNKYKPEFIEFLKLKLNNYSILLNVKVTEQKIEVHLYTDRDKFIELIKINPDLAYLKDKFNLDFEF